MMDERAKLQTAFAPSELKSQSATDEVSGTNEILLTQVLHTERLAIVSRSALAPLGMRFAVPAAKP